MRNIDMNDNNNNNNNNNNNYYYYNNNNNNNNNNNKNKKKKKAKMQKHFWPNIRGMVKMISLLKSSTAISELMRLIID